MYVYTYFSREQGQSGQSSQTILSSKMQTGVKSNLLDFIKVSALISCSNFFPIDISHRVIAKESHNPTSNSNRGRIYKTDSFSRRQTQITRSCLGGRADNAPKDLALDVVIQGVPRTTTSKNATKDSTRIMSSGSSEPSIGPGSNQSESRLPV